MRGVGGPVIHNQDPIRVTPGEESPAWDSDIDEREARRRKMFVFGGAAVAVIVGFVGLYALLSLVAGGLTTDSTTANNANQQFPAITGADPGAPPPVVVDVRPIGTTDELEWYAIESPLGQAQRVFASETGAFYALSTVPGQNINWPPPKAIYKSGDGENWEIISLDNSISANDMAVSGNAIYLIGTAPGAGNFDIQAPEIMVSASADGGTSWSQALLPTVAAPPDGAPVQWSNVRTRIAASNDAVVAVAQSQFFLDYRLLVPAEFGGDFDYRPTADGIAVTDWQIIEQIEMTCEQELRANGEDMDAVSEECKALFNGDETIASVGFVTWEEMGLVDGGQPLFSEMFVSADGQNFEAVESPFTAGDDLAGLYAVEDGFIGVGRKNLEFGGLTLFRSSDGRTWQEADGLPQFDWITNVGSIGGRAVVTGQGIQNSMMAWENEAGGWDIVDFDSVLGPVAANSGRWLASAGVGPMGVVAVFQSFDERTGRELADVAIGTSPQDWSLIPIDEITGMSGGYSNWVAVGPNQILIRYDVFNQFQQVSLQVMGVRTN